MSISYLPPIVGVAARATGSGTGFPAPPAPDPAAVGAPGSAALHPQAEEVVWVQAYDLDGKLVHDIKTKHPRLSFITAVAESGGTVWLGIMGSLW